MVAGFQNSDPSPAPPAAAPAVDKPEPMVLCSRIKKDPALAPETAAHNAQIATPADKAVLIEARMSFPLRVSARHFPTQIAP